MYIHTYIHVHVYTSAFLDCVAISCLSTSSIITTTAIGRVLTQHYSHLLTQCRYPLLKVCLPLCACVWVGVCGGGGGGGGACTCRYAISCLWNTLGRAENKAIVTSAWSLLHHSHPSRSRSIFQSHSVCVSILHVWCKC